jgi:hypothetical protein
MARFRKRPIVIEAERVPMPDQFVEHGLLLGMFFRHGFEDFMVKADKGYDIKTLEGVMHASPGDWIIRGVAGEFYPCRADIFEKTYEPA